LSAWLPRQRWFGAKTRNIQSVRVIDWAELPAAVAANTIVPPSTELPAVAASIPPALFYFEINYADNACDVYQVPLAFSAGGEAAEVLQHPERATHHAAGDGEVHLRPHEVFPPAEPAAIASPVAVGTPEALAAAGQPLPSTPHPLTPMTVAPAPITAQPGEAV